MATGLSARTTSAAPGPTTAIRTSISLGSASATTRSASDQIASLSTSTTDILPLGGSHMTDFKVGYFVGSLATKSINRLLAKALVGLAPPGLHMAEIPFKDLPLYSYDYDANFPPVATAFKDAIAAVDAVLFVTPEYNRSIPGALKNAIDWASRPRGTNSFAHKPSAVIGASTGRLGTAFAQQSLRSVLSFCNSPQMNAPEAYITVTPGLIEDDGRVTVESTEAFLRMFMEEFDAFIERVLTVLPPRA